MKKNIKQLTLTGMSGIMLAVTILPAFANDYSYDSYDSNYSYEEPNQNQSQYNNQYQAPNPNYQPGYSQPQRNSYQTQSYNQPPQQQNYNNMVPIQNSYSLPPLQGRVVSVPPGAMISGAAPTRDLSSKNLRTGDSVSVALNSPFYYAGSLVLPAGTNIMGTVVVAKAAGRAEANGQLMIVFNQAVTPTGQRYGISGKLATEDGSGLIKGGTGMDRTKEVVKDAAIGAGAGALLGTIFGAVSGGNAGKGAALGTAIGGGTGLAKTVIDKGNDVVLQAGKALDIILDSELRIGGDQNSSPAPSNYNQNYNNYGY